MVDVESQGAVDVVCPSVPLDADNVAFFRDALANSCAAGQPALVIDLQKTPLIDSAGLEALLDLRDRVNARGGLVKVAAPNPLCRDILRATGVDQRFETFSNAKAAVGSFAG